MKSFDGTAAHSKQGNTRVRDHCQTVNPCWRGAIDLIEAEQRTLNWYLIWIATIDVLGPQDLTNLAQDCWAFLGTVMADAIHTRRGGLAGGEGNGFELRRRLYLEHAGCSTQIHLHGIRSVHNFPHCGTVSGLQRRIGEWVRARPRTHRTCPEHLKKLFMGILPDDLRLEVQRRSRDLPDLPSIVVVVQHEIVRHTDRRLAVAQQQRQPKLLYSKHEPFAWGCCF